MPQEVEYCLGKVGSEAHIWIRYDIGVQSSLYTEHTQRNVYGQGVDNKGYLHYV